MRANHWICAVGLLFLGTSGVRAGDNWAPALAAAREVSSQLDAMQRAFATIPQVPGGRGLWGQADGIRIGLYQFRQTLQNGPSREDAVVAFFKLDEGVQQLLVDLKDMNDPAVKYVARRLAAAEADLHFAVVGPGNDPNQKTQALARQTIALATRAEELETMVKFAFLQDVSLPDWMAAVKDLRQKVAAFQTAQEKNLKPELVKAALVDLDRSWEAMVDRFLKLNDLTYITLQTDAVQFDAVLGRVDRIFGIENRKGRLPAKLLQW